MENNPDTPIIEELTDLYTRLGRITFWEVNNPEISWGNSGADKRRLLARMIELTSYLEHQGYIYDYFKGWTKSK